MKKLLLKLGLTEKDQKTIINVFKYSFLGAILIFGFSWIIQYGIIQYKSQKRTKEAMDPTLLYEKKSKDLLPIDFEAHLFTAQYYLKNDMPSKAIEHLLRIIPIQKNNQELQLNLATAYLSSTQYDKALFCFQKMIEQNLNDTIKQKVLARKGLALFYLGKIHESIKILDDCINNFPNSKEALCYRGQIEVALSENPQKAEEYFTKAISIDSTYTEAWYQLARYWMLNAQYAKARLYLLKVLELEPLNVKAHARLGMVYYYLDEPEFAKKSYLTALALNDNDFNTHYNLGELYYSKFMDEKNALIEFKKTLTYDPYHTEANFKTGLICLNNNMNKEAVQYFKKALYNNSNNVRILLQLAVAYEKLSLKNDALEIYKNIAQIDPLNKIALHKIKILSENN